MVCCSQSGSSTGPSTTYGPSGYRLITLLLLYVKLPFTSVLEIREVGSLCLWGWLERPLPQDRQIQTSDSVSTISVTCPRRVATIGTLTLCTPQPFVLLCQMMSDITFSSTGIFWLGSDVLIQM
jgi:hypothetical protein